MLHGTVCGVVEPFLAEFGDSNDREQHSLKDTMVKDMTRGSVPKLLLMFAMPLFIANALQALYNLVDMIVVGQVIGGAGMSAVSIGGDILHLSHSLAMGFSSMGQVLISQYVGAGKWIM